MTMQAEFEVTPVAMPLLQAPTRRFNLSLPASASLPLL